MNENSVAVVVTTPEIAAWITNGAAIITVEDPRLAFSILARAMGVYPPKLSIGKKCDIHPTSIIGADGLSANIHNGRIYHTAHLGSVIIGKGCRIGASAIIQRAVLRNTIVDDYCHIDVGVVFGHGSRMGKLSCIAANTVVCGTCTIGSGVWIGAGSVIRESITIGDDAFIGIGSVVIRDIPAGAIVAGNPARIIKNGRKPW